MGNGHSLTASVVPVPVLAVGSLAAVSVWQAGSLCIYSSTSNDKTCRFETSTEGPVQVSQLLEMGGDW